MLARYYYTLRHLRPIQILDRIRRNLFLPTPDFRPPPPLRQTNGRWKPSSLRKQSVLGPTRFKFLNQEEEVIFPDAWNSGCVEKLWLYNLHYFDGLNAIGSEENYVWYDSLVDRWIAENPPAKGIGWESYPTSLRIVNWIKWSLGGVDLSENCLESLAIQVRWLTSRIELHLLGNHLFENAKALCFAGLYFAGEEGDIWFKKGFRIIDSQLREQILPDGGHFELSPMYHLIVLEGLLDLVQLLSIYGKPVPIDWRAALERMLNWSLVMRHPDGDIPFFNDAAFGVAGTPAAVDVYAQSLGFVGVEQQVSLVHLKESGYLRMVCGKATLFADLADVGPDYLPGHAHADTLSFELSLGKKRVIVNGGTSVYGVDAERQRQRGTAAHSTVAVDGADSSEVWGGFRVARRARVRGVAVNNNDTSLWAVGEHDGYRRLPGAPVHRREWHLSADTLHIVDEVRGAGEHDIEIIFPLAPGLVPRLSPDGTVEVLNREGGMWICVLSFSDTGNVMLEEITWHPGFGESIPTWRVRIRVSGSLPIRHDCTLSWGKS